MFLVEMLDKNIISLRPMKKIQPSSSVNGNKYIYLSNQTKGSFPIYKNYINWGRKAGNQMLIQNSRRTLTRDVKMVMQTILVKDLIDEASKNIEYVGETIERKANRIAKTLSDNNKELVNYLTYSIREIMRNVVEHSKSPIISFWAKSNPSGDLVEIVVADNGIGVKNSLNSNPHYNINSDEEALILSLQPGVTKVYGRMRSNDIWQNSGYGLFMTSGICKRGGDFTICSGDSAIIINENSFENYKANYQGTFVKMRMKISKVTCLSHVLKDLSLEGSKLAKINSKLAVTKASQITTMLLNKL